MQSTQSCVRISPYFQRWRALTREIYSGFSFAMGFSAGTGDLGQRGNSPLALNF